MQASIDAVWHQFQFVGHHLCNSSQLSRSVGDDERQRDNAQLQQLTSDVTQMRRVSVVVADACISPDAQKTHIITHLEHAVEQADNDCTRPTSLLSAIQPSNYRAVKLKCSGRSASITFGLRVTRASVHLRKTLVFFINNSRVNYKYGEFTDAIRNQTSQDCWEMSLV